MFIWCFGNMLFSLVPNFSFRTNREQLLPFLIQNINARDILKFKKVAQNCFIFVLNSLLKFLQVLFLILFLLVFTIFLFPSAESQDSYNLSARSITDKSFVLLFYFRSQSWSVRSRKHLLTLPYFSYHSALFHKLFACPQVCAHVSSGKPHLSTLKLCKMFLGNLTWHAENSVCLNLKCVAHTKCLNKIS